MNIPLDQFEQHISETILKRGLSYYKSGSVESVDEISAGEYFAIVSGSEHYEVEIKIKNNTIINIYCDCPFDGVVCKHAVAVIFSIQAEVLQLNDVQTQATSKAKKAKTAKEKTPKEQLISLLNRLEKEELITSLIELATKDKSLLYQLLSKYSYLNQEQTQTFYTNQVKNILKSAQARDGFIGYHEIKKLRNQLDELIENAKKQAEQKNKQGALFICWAIIEELIAIMDSVDDSDGYVYGFVEEALEILNNIATGEAKEEYAPNIFYSCIEKIKIKLGDGYGFLNSLIWLGCTSILHKEQVQILKQYLKSTKESKYENEFYARTEYNLIERFEGIKQAQEFLHENLHHSSLREKAIKQAIEIKDYSTAKKIANEGIAFDKEYVGLRNAWWKYLLQIAELEKNKKTIVEIALFLFNDNHYDFTYYYIVKKNATNQEWQQIVKETLQKLNSSTHWLKPYDTIAKIYFEEQHWDELLAVVTEFASFELLAKYEATLNEHFHSQLTSLYERSIRNYLEKNVDRSHYVIACKAIKRLKAITPNHNINYLINEFREKYKRRPALIELINKI